MALKDWMKIGKLHWKNIKKTLTSEERMHSVIKIKKVNAPTSVFGNKFAYQYRVSLRNSTGNIENRATHFKTKSQALKFTMDYMRKH